MAGTAAAFSFTDTAGNAASGNLTFDNGQLYLRATTAEPVSSVYPNVSCIMSRTQVQLQPDPTVTPTPAEQAQNTAETGEYFFPESSNRYLTDEEISAYSSDQLIQTELISGKRFFDRDWRSGNISRTDCFMRILNLLVFFYHLSTCRNIVFSILFTNVGSRCFICFL